ncbi:MAG: protein TolQ [Dissulfurimicrobium sp.]|uniref:protein TolQ n=1 Tax=Dissulfurimicrobium sp. TaxID=2022436 RepID=UPI00404992F7
MPLNENDSILSIILEAGPIVQMVLLLLISLSLLSWTIIIVKFKRFRQARRLNEEFEELFWDMQNLGQLYSHAKRMDDAPMAGVFLAGYEELRRLQESIKGRDAAPGPRVWIESLERSLNKGIQKEITMMENGIPFLATIGNSAPFIGLFGTVWGIMRSFHSIGLQGSASLATVAPGISEALIATAVGLSVAIPAVIAFNIFMGSLARIESTLQGFSSDFINAVERKLLPGKNGKEGA